MKQIGNWVFGSFFRTIGRILVFVLIGFIIARFVDFGSIKDNFDITDLLGIEKVDALTLTQDVNVYDSKVISYTNTDLTQDLLFYKLRVNSSGSQQYYAWNVSNYGFTPEIDFIEIPIMFQFTNQAATDVSNVIDICDRWKWWTRDSNNQVIEWGCEHVTSYTIRDREYMVTDQPSGLQFSFYAHNTDGGYSMCQIQNNYLMCPTRQRDIDFIGMLYDFRAPTSTANINMNVSLGTVWNRYQANSTVDAIHEQTQQQQQNHEETQNYLEDSNSTSTENSANNFFGNFSTSDTGGLSSIITAPLVMVNKMLDGQCVMPSATWKGATISLPCGDMLWSRPGASDLKNLLNVFYGGFICYYAIRKLFLMIEGMKDPTSDRIEVSDL